MDYCETSSRLSAYIDNEVGEAERVAIARHVEECALCASLLRELQETSTQIRQLPEPAVPARMMRRLHARVDQGSRRGAERLAEVLSALAACLAVVGGLSLMRTSEAQPAPAPWEEPAVAQVNEDTASESTRDSEARWIVADLSERGSEHE